MQPEPKGIARAAQAVVALALVWGAPSFRPALAQTPTAAATAAATAIPLLLPVVDEASPVPVPALRGPAVLPLRGGLAWRAEEVRRLDADVDALIDRSATLAAAHVGIVAVDARDGATLYAHNADQEFQPASTLKLLVGSAALERLGRGFRFRTDAYASPPFDDATPAQGGAFSGKLVLHGGGDPLLSAHDLAGFAQTLARLGVRRAGPGALAIDPSHYERSPYPAGWVWDDFAQDYAPAVNAMTVEENVIHLFVRAGSSGGVEVTSAPLPDVLSPGSAPCAPTEDVVVRSQVALLPARAESTLDVARDPNGCLDLIGGIPAGTAGESIDAAVPSPPEYAYRIAVQALERAGIEMAPESPSSPPWDDRTARVPAGSMLVWSHLGPPLGSWIGPRFWIPSDNLAAELLLREIGCASAGEPGTSAKGIAFERRFAQTIGIDPKTMTLADGSGLSQYDRITPRDLAAILRHDWDGPLHPIVLNSLPIGGARGTIEGIAGTPLAGRVYAKTGSMSHVRGLAGYLATERHGTVIFAFNVDDFNGDPSSLAAVRALVLSRISSA